MAKKQQRNDVASASECPHSPETQQFFMGSWARKPRTDRIQIAHQVALREMRREPSDPYLYRRTLSHLLNGVTYPEAYKSKSYVRLAGDNVFRLVNELQEGA